MAKKIDKQALRMKIQELDIDNELKSQLLDAVSEKKTFGLVWEEKEEEAQERLRKELPVFVEDESKRIVNSDDAPNHIVIEGDNLHALTALCYSHEGKFDAIYIDPPYNSGATDWKYNNDYVDKEDEYRHSKWLDMMKHRLDIAKRLLNPENSVLIVTIDEKEYLHLGCLLEEMFPNARMQMVSDAINRKGSMRQNGFQKTDEYLFFVNIGEAGPCKLPLSKEWTMSEEETSKGRFKWQPFIRGNFTRKQRPKMFFPICTNMDGTKILRVGKALPLDVDRKTVIANEGEKVVFPITSTGAEAVWHLNYDSFVEILKKGYVKLGKSTKDYAVSISYLSSGTKDMIENGTFSIIGYNEDGSVEFDTNSFIPEFVTGTQWRIKSHDATSNGTKLLTDIVGKNKFSYPKSLYSVHDTLMFYIRNNPNAKVLDFFAGSGTTMHATMTLNEEDGGNRQCILVSNNESNICEDVTYERNKRVINGYTKPNGEFVEGLHHNNLRFYRTAFVPRDLSIKGQRDLMAASTDLLCIKNDLYDEKEMFGNIRLRKHIARYFDNGKDKMIIIYKVEAIESIVAEMMEMTDDTKIKVYVFSTNNYAMEADFEDVADKVELYAMPAALWNAYKKVLPKRLNTIDEEEENA